ncbi:WYL domain-containing protein, partial [Curtobacterium sp. VKM Ac-2887]|nr:WYL domain-containing protein [Curtobacterium sp. VKM Ac-2887]
DYSLPPLNLSAAESLAMLAGLALLESSPYQGAARRARAKIAAIMNEDHREPVQEVLGTIHVNEAAAETHDAVSLGILSDVIAAKRVVRLSYTGEAEDGSPDHTTSTVRDVETMGLLRAGDAWLLTGWCRLRHAIRGFRISRITHLEILDEVPPDRDPTLLRADL